MEKKSCALSSLKKKKREAEMRVFEMAILANFDKKEKKAS